MVIVKAELPGIVTTTGSGNDTVVGSGGDDVPKGARNRDASNLEPI